jgi:hypothetical protein
MLIKNTYRNRLMFFLFLGQVSLVLPMADRREELLMVDVLKEHRNKKLVQIFTATALASIGACFASKFCHLYCQNDSLNINAYFLGATSLGLGALAFGSIFPQKRIVARSPKKPVLNKKFSPLVKPSGNCNKDYIRAANGLLSSYNNKYQNYYIAKKASEMSLLFGFLYKKIKYQSSATIKIGEDISLLKTVFLLDDEMVNEIEVQNSEESWFYDIKNDIKQMHELKKYLEKIASKGELTKETIISHYIYEIMLLGQRESSLRFYKRMGFDPKPLKDQFDNLYKQISYLGELQIGDAGMYHWSIFLNKLLQKKIELVGIIDPLIQTLKGFKQDPYFLLYKQYFKEIVEGKKVTIFAHFQENLLSAKDLTKVDSIMKKINYMLSICDDFTELESFKKDIYCDDNTSLLPCHKLIKQALYTAINKCKKNNQKKELRLIITILSDLSEYEKTPDTEENKKNLRSAVISEILSYKDIPMLSEIEGDANELTVNLWYKKIHNLILSFKRSERFSFGQLVNAANSNLAKNLLDELYALLEHGKFDNLCNT